MSGPLPDIDHLRLLLEQVEQRMKNQRDEWDGLDRKATTILATTGVLLGLVAANAKAFGATPSPGPAAFVLAAAALALSLAAGVVALFPRRFSDVPDPQPFLDLYTATPTDQTLGTLASTKANEYTKNEGAARSKRIAVRVQMLLVFAAGAMLVVPIAREVI